MKTRNFGIFLL